jgi:protein PhnA
MSIEPSLLARAENKCELCGSSEALERYDVPSGSKREAAIVVCGACAGELDGGEALDANRWHCLESAIWSEVPAVQVASHRLLERLRDEGWARDLLDQAYLADDVLAWAKEGLAEAPEDDRVDVRDSHGTPLAEGDSVTLVKDLDVKGAGFTAKRGTMVKGIRLGGDPTHIEGRVNGVTIMLKTEFLKKA